MIQCTNSMCPKSAICLLFKSASDNKRHYQNTFNSCSEFICFEHKFTHVHGQPERVCRECDLKESEVYKVDNHTWSFAIDYK